MGLDLDDYDFENPIGFDGENETNPDGTPKTDEKFLGMPKKVGIGVTIGVGVLALTGIIIAVARKK